MTRSDPSTGELLAALSRPATPDPAGLSRRRFLQAAAVLGGAAAVPAWMAAAAEAATPIGPGDGILVLVTMAGGNDGLSMTPPISDGTYHDERGELALTAETTHRLTADRGLHPAMPSLARLWHQGMVAVIDGVGVPDGDLSHFSSMARWMAGRTGASGFATGWLGRYLDGLGDEAGPYHAIAIGSSLPLTLVGQSRQGSALPPNADGSLDLTEQLSRDELDAVVGFGAAASGLGPWGDALAGSGAVGVDLARQTAPAYQVALPEGDVAAQLALCAQLINADLGIRVLSVSYGDFDSHADQAPMQQARLADLDQGLNAFYGRLNSGFHSRTLILAVSEFGRRVRTNGSAGTDHGTANTLLAIGPQVNGGFYGQFPSLTDLDPEGNVRTSVDFRSVYGTVLDTWLNADSAEVLDGRHENLGFVAAPAPNRSTSGLDPSLTSAVFDIRAQIGRLYLAYFGRLPETEGLEHWSRARRTGLALAAVSDSLAGSAEFRDRYGSVSNRGFVDLVYRNVLGRDGDAGGVAYWTGLLDDGRTRGTVMLGFSESPEFVRTSRARVAELDSRGAIARLYQAYFGRAGDAAGIRYWIGSGLPLGAVSDAFARSEEFTLRYGSVSNAGFVELVYHNVLGRAPDPEGRRYWLAQADRGVPRGRLMLAFSESPEFIARTGTLA
ncbi:MAG: DUF4214 domain-containing protein [Acidimicrobiales bacterium]